jgi:hypothetical protein
MKRFLHIKVFCLLSLVCFLSGCGARENSNSAAKRESNNQTAAIPVSAPERDAAEPAIASAPDGSIYVVWVEHLPERRADVYVRRFDSEQKPLGEAVRVNPEQGRATAWRGDPPTIKVSPDGSIYVGWTARVDAAQGGANDLYLSVSRDGGRTFEAPVKVNDDKIPASHGMHSLDIGKSGRVFLAWLDERYLKQRAENQSTPVNQPENDSGAMKHPPAEPNGEVYFAVSSDYGRTFSANKKIAGNACPCCKTSMASAPDGRLYLAWRQVLDGDFRHIAVAASADGGSSFEPPVIVSNDQWQINACPVSGAALAVDSKNDLHIVWFNAGQAGTAGVYQSQSKDGGRTFAPRSLVNADAAGGTPVLMYDLNDEPRIVISAMDKTIYLLSAPNDAAEFKEQNHITDAELPGAIISKGKIYVAFSRKNDEKGNIYFLRQE